MSKLPYISFDKVNVFYGDLQVLNDVSFSINKGDKIAVIGPNGSGKTTLVKTIMGYHKDFSGCLRVNLKIKFGYAPQRGHTDILVPLSVYEYLILNINKNDNIGQKHKLIDIWGDKLEIKQFFDLPFRNLSGGQKQRAILLRAISGLPDCLILDEPTDNLDIAAQKKVFSIINEFCAKEKVTLILITHSLANVLNNADRLIVFHQTKTKEILLDDLTNLEQTLRKIFNTDLALHKINTKIVVL
ncbi:ATP-binding cassette domain-containing protein [bacterium]|nr:ATP-binding cassette domain-containing protein [bacterium]